MIFNDCTCAICGIVFGIGASYEAILRKDGKGFFCPNGHSLTFGEGEADKLRRERDRLMQDAARLVDEAREADQARQFAGAAPLPLAARSPSSRIGPPTASAPAAIAPLPTLRAIWPASIPTLWPSQSMATMSIDPIPSRQFTKPVRQ